MKKIKKFVCLLLVVCFSVTTFPHVFASAAETSSACPFELGDTITFKSNDPDSPYLVYDNPLMQAPSIQFSDTTKPENEFEVIDVCDDGSFCLGIKNVFGMDYNICATRKGLVAKPYQNPTNFVLEDAGNGQYYMKANEGDCKGQYLYQYANTQIEFKSDSKTPLTICKNGVKI